MRLPGHRTEPRRLPEEPLVDLYPRTLALRIEPAGLAAEILQDRARLEHGDRLAARPVMIDDGGHAVVGGDGQEFRPELLAFGDVHRMHDIRKPAFLEHDRDLPAVRRRPEIEIDRLALGARHGACCR